jgi:toxin ParE1/3/4
MGDAYRAIMSPEAGADLAAIHSYISRDSKNNAAKMVERILEAIESLKETPHRTVLASEGRKVVHPVRTLVVKPYVIYFRAIDDEGVVRILTIRHGARRRPRKFGP